MKICPKCSAQLNDNVKFCTVCGTLQSVPMKNQAQPQTQSIPVQSQQAPVQQQYSARPQNIPTQSQTQSAVQPQQNFNQQQFNQVRTQKPINQPQAQVKAKKGKGKVIAIVSVILAVLIAGGAAGYLFWLKPKLSVKKQEEPTAVDTDSPDAIDTDSSASVDFYRALDLVSPFIFEDTPEIFFDENNFYLFEYDDKNRITDAYHSFEPYTHFSAEYNDNGNVSFIYVYIIDEIYPGTVELCYYAEYKYDNDGNISEAIAYEWDEDMFTYEETLKCAFDKNGKYKSISKEPYSNRENGTVTYNDDGYLESIHYVDNYGDDYSDVTYKYDNNGNLISIDCEVPGYDYLSSSTLYAYTTDGKIETIEYIGGIYDTIYTYDKNGLLISEEYSDGSRTTKYEYNSNGSLSSMITTYDIDDGKWEAENRTLTCKYNSDEYFTGYEDVTEYNSGTETIVLEVKRNSENEPTELSCSEEGNDHEYMSVTLTEKGQIEEYTKTYNNGDIYSAVYEYGIKGTGRLNDLPTKYTSYGNGEYDDIIIYEYNEKNLLVKESRVSESGAETSSTTYEYNDNGIITLKTETNIDSEGPEITEYDEYGREID